MFSGHVWRNQSTKCYIVSFLLYLKTKKTQNVSCAVMTGANRQKIIGTMLFLRTYLTILVMFLLGQTNSILVFFPIKVKSRQNG
jgi:hypothetical protein